MNRTQMTTLLTGTAFLLSGLTFTFSAKTVGNPHPLLIQPSIAENSGGIIILPHDLPVRTV